MTHIISHHKEGFVDVVKVNGGLRLLDIAHELGMGSKAHLRRLFKQGAIKRVETGEIIKDYETKI